MKNPQFPLSSARGPLIPGCGGSIAPGAAAGPGPRGRAGTGAGASGPVLSLSPVRGAGPGTGIGIGSGTGTGTGIAAGTPRAPPGGHGAAAQSRALRWAAAERQRVRASEK